MNKVSATVMGAVLLSGLHLDAQHPVPNLPSAYLQAAGDHAALFQGRLEPGFEQSAWLTHPYWGDDAFHRGSVCYNGLVYDSVLMRYNVLDNRLSVIAPESRLPVVPRPDLIDYLVMDGICFVPNQGHFDRVLYAGQNLLLLHRREKHRGTDVVIDYHAYRDMNETNRYLLCMPDGTVSEVSNAKSLMHLFPQWKKEIRHLCRQQGLSFGPVSRSASLERCAAEIDRWMRSDPTAYPAVSDRPDAMTPSSLQARLSASGSALTTAPPAAIPESIYIDIPRVKQVAAYRTYVPGFKAAGQPDGDEEPVSQPVIPELAPLRETRTLGEVEVVGLRQKGAQPVSGMESFRPSMLRNVPLAVGEADVLRLALTLPGVSSTGDASSGLNVRGGASDQNLLLMNGSTVFNAMHMFGLFSAFNPDLVAESELYKGGIPSQYGGRLSSVMNIRGRTADKEHFHGSASIGLVTAKAVADIPIVKDRASLLLGGRTTYSDWMLGRLPEESGYRNGEAGFWDLGGTLSVDCGGGRNPTSRLSYSSILLNGYLSHDRFAFTEYDRYEYSNMNLSAEWRARFGSDLSTSLTAGLDHYDYCNENRENDYAAARLSFGLNQTFLKSMATWRMNDSHTFNAGLQGQYYGLMPGSYQPLGDVSFIVGRQLPDAHAVESALWAEDSWTVTPGLNVTGGVRLNMFHNSSTPSAATTFLNPDFRLSASCQLNDNQSVKAGFQTLHQYIHKVSNTVIMSPTDTWALSDGNIHPQAGWQLSAGYYWQSSGKDYECSAEAYYKGMDHYLTYRSAAQLLMNDELYKDVAGTLGRAYGIELQLRKLYGRLNGWVSYTYARTRLRQEKGDDGVAINQGEWFAADYDTPHQFKLVSNFKFTRRYSMSLNADYSTGRPFTAPVGQFYDEQHRQMVPIYSDRNACRMPDYCRVDASFNVEPSHHLTNLTHSWFTIGVYNVLGRKNAYSIYYKSEGASIQGYKLSIFGAPIPYVSYNIRF